MLIYCYKCLKEHAHSGEIPTTGKQYQCSRCGYPHTLYPSGVIIGDFHDYLRYHTQLSTRAILVIIRNVSSVNHFLSQTRRDFLRFKNCGWKTASELCEYSIGLRQDLGISLNVEKSKEKAREKTIPAYFNNDELFEIIASKLTTKCYQLIVEKYRIDSLEKIMALESENLRAMKNCGIKTFREIYRLQNIVTEMLQIVHFHSNRTFDNFKSLLKLEKRVRNLLEIGEDIDPQEPFLYLDKWVLSIAKGSERNKMVFMQRMGMIGEKSLTYQQIGVQHDISRERVRSIVEALKRTGLNPTYSLRVDPLIEQTKKIVRAFGGKIELSDLITRLLHQGTQGELLKHAIPFMEYLNGFSLWQKVGLKIRDGFVCIVSEQDL